MCIHSIPNALTKSMNIKLSKSVAQIRSYKRKCVVHIISSFCTYCKLILLYPLECCWHRHVLIGSLQRIAQPVQPVQQCMIQSQWFTQRGLTLSTKIFENYKSEIAILQKIIFSIECILYFLDYFVSHANSELIRRMRPLFLLHLNAVCCAISCQRGMSIISRAIQTYGSRLVSF